MRKFRKYLIGGAIMLSLIAVFTVGYVYLVSELGGRFLINHISDATPPSGDSSSGDEQNNPGQSPSSPNANEDGQNEPDDPAEQVPPETLTEAQNLMGELSFSDRVTVTMLIQKKLSPSDIVHLAKLFSEGLNGENKEEAVKLAYERFSPEEIKQIKEFYSKYKHLLD